MIDTLYFGIGFMIYVFFSLLTMDIYSKKEGITPTFILGAIYAFYSILAVYVINFVDVYGTTLEIAVQSAIYVVFCGIILFQHYTNSIRKKDLEMYGNRS